MRIATAWLFMISITYGWLPSSSLALPQPNGIPAAPARWLSSPLG
jgi:hypothetical protein